MKKFNRRMFLLFVFLLTSCGDEVEHEISVVVDPATIGFANHLSSSEKISLVFPENWERKDLLFLEDPKVIAAFSEFSEDPTDKFLETVLLIKTDSTAGVTDHLSKRTNVTTKQAKIAGFTGTETIFDADVAGEDGLNLRFMSINFEFNGSTYGLLYSAKKDTFERNTRIVRHMAAGMNIGHVIMEGLDSTSDLAMPGKPSISTDGTNFLVVSCRQADDFPYAAELLGRVVNEDRTMGQLFQIQDDVNRNGGCGSYDAIFDGTNYLVVYIAYFEGNRRLVGKRISPAGDVIDTFPIDISKNSANLVFEPDLAFDGNRTLVVWNEYGGEISRIKGAFVERDGIVKDSVLIEDNLSTTFSEYVYSPRVSSGNNQFMVIWSRYYLNDIRIESGMPIFAQLLDLNGSLMLPEAVQIRSDNGDNPRFAQITSDGTNYLVGWIEGLLETNTVNAGSFSIYARQINPLGELVGSAASDAGVKISLPVFLAENASKEVPKQFLDLSYHEGNYLFLWSSANYNPDDGVYGAKVSRDLGSISAAAPISGLARDTPEEGLSQPSQANASYSVTQNFVVWASDSGVLEGWFIGFEQFK